MGNSPLLVGNTALYSPDMREAYMIVAYHHGWALVGKHPLGHDNIYVVRPDVATWIEKQPLHMWKHHEAMSTGHLEEYLISEELISWMILRWS